MISIKELIGIIGALLFFLKIGIHVFIEWKSDKKFELGTFMNPTNLSMVFPIFSNVVSGLKNVKRIGNVIYIISLVLITVFLIWENF